MTSSLTVVETKLTLRCPACEQSTGCTFQHLVDEVKRKQTSTRQWSWNCDHCNAPFSFSLNDTGDVTSVVPNPTGSKIIPTLDLLTLDRGPLEDPIFFVQWSTRYERGMVTETREEILAHKQYHYEEHSCPTNWFGGNGGFKMIFVGNDTDPHGVIEFVDSVDEEAVVYLDGSGNEEVDHRATFQRVAHLFE